MKPLSDPRTLYPSGTSDLRKPRLARQAAYKSMLKPAAPARQPKALTGIHSGFRSVMTKIKSAL